MKHEHLTPNSGLPQNRSMAEGNVDPEGQSTPPEINSERDANEYSAGFRSERDASLNQIRESLKEQGYSDEVADRIARGFAQEEARVAGEGGEPPEEPPEAPAVIPPEEPEEPPDGPEAPAAGREGEENEDAGDIGEVNDNTIQNILRRGRKGVEYSESDEERYNALKQAALDIISLEEKEVPEGSPSFTSQKTSAVFAIEEEMKAIAERSASVREKALSEDERMQMRINIAKMRELIVGSDSDGDKMDKIEELVNGLDPNERTYPHIIAEAIKGIEGKEHDYLIEDILEYSLERFLNRADAQPLEDYPQFTFTESENMSIIMQAGRRFDEARKKTGTELGLMPGRKEMFKYLTALSGRRRVMHEVFKSLNDLESYTGLVTKALRKNGMSFIEKQLVGVSDIQIVYDQVLLLLKSLKPTEQGWLLEEDFETGDSMVRELFDESAKNNSDEFNKKFIRGDGTLDTRPLRQWEIDRAFHMGRDLSAASQRRVVYGILGDVPENVDDFLKSVAHEPIARRLAPLKLIPERFFSHGMAKRFLSIFKNEQKRKEDGTIDRNKYGYVKNGKDIGLFGSSQDDFAILDTGINDPKSNPWRARLLFLKNPRFLTEIFKGKQVTVGSYLDETFLDFTRGLHGRVRKQAIKNWNESIRGRISSQRISLGVLMRYPELDEGNKTAIWNNVGKNIPSRIASLLPNEALEIVDSRLGLNGDRDQAVTRWTGIAKKLWVAERLRVANDARVLSGHDGEIRDVDYFFEKAGLTDAAEITIVKQIQELGKKFAPTLANVKFPFTAFLDDVPETDWERLSDFDFTRIMVSDQSAFQEGYGPIIGLFDNPVQKPEDVAKAIVESFEKIKIPPGVKAAQKIFEPIVKSAIKMRQMFTRAKWMGPTLSRLFRIPTSPIEEYNLSAHVADDENDTAGMLHVLAQKEVLSDDPHEVDEKGKTQYMRVKDELGADRKAVLLAYGRLIIQLFGPAFGIEFMKAMGIKLQ